MNIHVLFKRTLLIYILLLLNNISFGDNSQIKAFFESGVTYGFFGSHGLYCYPEYKEPRVEPPEDYIRPKVYKMYEERDRKDIFDLPPGYIDNHIKDRVGDTVMVIYAGTREYGVIDTIVYYWPELEEGAVCVVKSLGAKFESAGYPPNVMILRKEKFYTGPFIPYVEYKFVDNSYLNLKDSLKTVMIDSYIQENPEKIRNSEEDLFYTIHVACYGKKNDSIPDTLYMVYACYRYSAASWLALFKIHKEGRQWVSQSMLKPHWGSAVGIEFNCAFDLDNDGVSEYYINNDIYQISGTTLRLIYEGPFIGDI